MQPVLINPSSDGRGTGSLPAEHESQRTNGIRWAMQGRNVPVLRFVLEGDPDPASNIFFRHPAILFTTAEMPLGSPRVSGYVSGTPIVICQSMGAGVVALGHDQVGTIQAVELRPGQELRVRGQQFLAATANLEHKYVHLRSLADSVKRDEVPYIDVFSAPMNMRGTGMVWIHSFGDAFLAELEPGEQFDAEPGGWSWMESTVSIEPHSRQLPVPAGMGAVRLFMERLTGPGKVCLQSAHIVEESLGHLNG